MTVTRTFTPDQLAAMGIPNGWEAEDGNAAEILHDEQTDTRRWSSTHWLVFRAPDDGKAYGVNYQLPLTEYQEADRWFGDDTIAGVEVAQVPVTVQEWKPADVVQQPAPAVTDEHRLWQNLADALNALADYGIDALAGTVSPALVDAGNVIHGGGVRVGGQRLCWLGAGGNDDHDFGSKWIVEDRDGFKAGE